jgi:hypothetical protein
MITALGQGRVPDMLAVMAPGVTWTTTVRPGLSAYAGHDGMTGTPPTCVRRSASTGSTSRTSPPTATRSPPGSGSPANPRAAARPPAASSSPSKYGTA